MKTVFAIVNKLLQTLEETYLNKVERIGQELAQKICEIALKWGNLHALIWKYDPNFARHLGVNALNR